MKSIVIEISAIILASSAITATASVTEDDRIRAYCLVGSIAGSLAYILKQKIYEHDGVMATFFTNVIVACLFSPLMCDRLPSIGVDVTFRSCLALSGALGLASPWLLSTVFPILGKKVVKAANEASPRTLAKRIFNLKDGSDGKL